MRSITSFGVPAVVSKPIHWIASKLGKPCSATVGRSGSCASRLKASARDRTQRASLDLRQRKQRRDRSKLRVAGDHRGHGGRATAIGDVLQLDVRLAAEQLDDEMGLSGRAGRGVIELAGIGLGQRHEFCERMGRHFRIYEKQ